jgi:heat shock protein HslJ
MEFIYSMKTYLLTAMLLPVIFLAACTSQAATVPTPAKPDAMVVAAGQSAQATAVDDTAAIPLEKLKNATYSGVLEQPITLQNGSAHYEDGGSNLPYVTLIDHQIAVGDLNGDGAADAVVPLVDTTTGSADFVYLVPVLNVMTNPAPQEAFQIGDRTPVKSISIEGGQVLAEFLAPGPEDPACCSSMKVRRSYALENGKLVERSSQELGKVSVKDLDGTNWKLINLNGDQEPVLPDTEITLGFASGQVSGSAGCNNYNTSLVTRQDDLPQVFKVGPIAGTKKICSEPISNQETTYLDNLANVSAWRYDFGQLALTYKRGENDFGVLLFEALNP